MNIQALLPLLAAIAFIPLLWVVMARRPWQKEHKLLFFYLLCAMLWSSGAVLFRSHFFMEDKLLLAKVTIAIMVIAGVQLHYFAQYFYLKKPGFPYLYLLTTVILAVVIMRVPEDIVIRNNIVEPVYGVWVGAIFLFLYTVLIRDIFLLLLKRNKLVEPEKRNQLNYFSLGIIILLVFNSLSATPIGKSIPIGHLGNIITAVILTYATLRHELVSAKFVTRRGLAYCGVFSVIASFYFLILGFLVYGLRLELDFITAAIVALITGILLGGVLVPHAAPYQLAR